MLLYMKFLLLCFINYIQKNNLFLEKSNTLYDKVINNTNKYSGFDYRYIENEDKQNIIIYKIQKNFENKRLLNILENNNINIHTKIGLLYDNSVKPTNIMSGGLMTNYDFEF